MKHIRRLHSQAIVLLSLAVFTAFVTGCGGLSSSTTPTPTPGPTTLTLTGSVHTGTQAISGSTVVLYVVGTAGNASAATPFVPAGDTFQASGSCASGSTCYSGATTGATGQFTISGDFTCPSSTSQLYLVAKGGNPGLASGVNNSSIVLLDALGSCSTLLSTPPTVTVNEVTTVAAAWALAPFSSSSANIGSTSTNTEGLNNAILNAQLLANPSTGASPGASLLSSTTIESSKLNTLADALSVCVHSDGTACSALFSAATPAAGTAPQDTFTAALNIVKNPGQNVASVFSSIQGTVPYTPQLAQAPNDWTMSLTVTGGGLTLPTALDIDANGNVWTVGQEGPLVAFGPQGKVLSGASGFGTGYLEESFGLTIDSKGNVWVADYQSPSNNAGSVVAFQGLAGTSPGTEIATFTDSSLSNPDWLLADSNGNVFAANFNGYSASVYNTSGLVTPGIGATYGYAFPQALAIDSTHGVWLSDGDTTISHYGSNGVLLGHPNCCYGSYGMATDKYNNVWVANYLDSTFSEVSSTNTVPIHLAAAGGINTPAAVNIDGAQNVWFTNYQAGTITEIAGNGSPVLAGTTTPLAAGTAISPSATTQSVGGYGLDSHLSLPIGIVMDASGDVWVANESMNDLVMFFGLAAPTATPVQPVPAAP